MWQRWKSSQTLRCNTNTVLHSWYNIIGIFNILWYSSIEKTYISTCQYPFYPIRYIYFTSVIFFATKWYCEPYQSDISVCLKGVKLAITCSLFMIILQLIVIHFWKSQICCSLVQSSFSWPSSVQSAFTLCT